MFTAQADVLRRLTWIVGIAGTLLAISGLLGLAGCGCPPKTCCPLDAFGTCPHPEREKCNPCPEVGYCDQTRTQVQFYAPPGAIVTVRDCPTRSHQVAVYGAFENRLEQNPEQFAVFNLHPGRYEFKYTSAEGLPGVTVYGELDVKIPFSTEGRLYQRRAFVPIALPSEYYRRVEVNGPEIFPYRGEAYRTAIDGLDIERLRQGDVVEKVFVVANLEHADKNIAKLRQEIAEQERKIEYADARFRYAYMDFHSSVAGDEEVCCRCLLSCCVHKDRDFIEWEGKRQKLEHELDVLNARLKRTQALLNADRVLTREGMMVVATEEVVRPHEDPLEASRRIGEVLLVMRVGGRHMHWGDPNEEVVNLP